MGGAAGGPGLGFGDPISKTEKGAHFPAFVPALLDLGIAHIRETERVFVSSNGVDQRVGCFHQDLFPFGFYLFEPSLSLKNANLGEELAHSLGMLTPPPRNFMRKQPILRWLRLEAC